MRMTPEKAEAIRTIYGRYLRCPDCGDTTVITSSGIVCIGSARCSIKSIGNCGHSLEELRATYPHQVSECPADRFRVHSGSQGKATSKSAPLPGQKELGL